MSRSLTVTESTDHPLTACNTEADKFGIDARSGLRFEDLALLRGYSHGGHPMKYMIEYSVRTAGLSHDQNLDNQEALTKAFGTWAPEEGLTIHAFVANLNNGGYIFAEAAHDELGSQGCRDTGCAPRWCHARSQTMAAMIAISTPSMSPVHCGKPPG